MRSYKWILGGLLLVAVAVVAVVVNNYRANEQREQEKLQAALDRAESLGLAVYAEHLRANPVPDGENAFVEYASLLELVVDEEWWGSGKIYPGQLLDVEDPVKRDLFARQMVEDWQPALELARAGAKKPKFDAQREWELGPIINPQDSPKMIDVCRILIEEARIRFDDNEPEASLESLRTMLAIIEHYKSEGEQLTFLMMLRQEEATAKEIVRQAQITTSVRRLQELKALLEDMFKPVPAKVLVRNEIVKYVEFIKLVNEDNEYGESFREVMKEMQISNPITDVFGTTLPAGEAREFEVRAINEACDFIEAVSDDLNDYERNEELFRDMIGAPFDWAVDGFPLGFLRPYEVYNGFDYGPVVLTHKQHARHVVCGDVYRSAFDHVTGKATLADAVSWASPSLELAVLTFNETELGFEVTIDMPGFKPRPYKFERP